MNSFDNIFNATKSKTAGKSSRIFVQPKLMVNGPGDPYEQQTDAVADRIMTENDVFIQPKIISNVQRKCAHCEEEEEEENKMQRKEFNGEEVESRSGIENYIDSLSGRGQQMPEEVRRFYEPRFGYDFSNVKLHTDAVAAKSAQDINALAYTSGNNIVFNQNQFSFPTSSGKKLLAHELTHVVQQSKVTLSQKVQRRAVDDDAHLTCRAARPTAFADIQARERQAIIECRGAAAALRSFTPAVTRGAETAATHNMRDMLWRRFHLNYNLQGRCAGVPDLIDKYTAVADSISNTDYTYECAAPGTEPSGECTTRPNQGLAWTARGTPNTMLCDAYWGNPVDETRTIIHELFHYNYDLGDCPTSHDNNPECYVLFAGEIAGSASSGDTSGGCCDPPSDPLPAADTSSFDSSCPSGVTIGFPELQAGYSYGSGGHGSYLTLGGDVGIPFGRSSSWELALGPRLTFINSLDTNARTSYLLGVRVGLQLRTRPWRSGFTFGGFLEGGAAFDIPDRSGTLGSGGYGAAGIHLGGAIPLPGNRAISLFAEFAGGAGLNANDQNLLGHFRAGLGASIEF
jgi:hypothetical protein